MVQQGLPLQQRSLYPGRENNWNSNERPFLNSPLHEGFNNGGSIHPRTLTIEESLKECARLTSLDKFALIVLQDNGEERTYTSQSLKLHQSQIFTESFRTQFRAAAEGSLSSSAYEDSMFTEFDADNETKYRKQSSSCDSSSGRFRRQRQRNENSDYSDKDDSPTVKRRRNRRHRGPLYPNQLGDNMSIDTPMPVAMHKNQPLVIGESIEVEKLYSIRFRDMQQSSCKVIGKAFVKFVEPKKQTHHPYTHGDEKAPEWWPPTTGENKIRHKEPDHLLKGERVALLVHILRLVVQPHNQQHHSIQKLNLNVKKLEEVTMEAMSRWFDDKDNPANADKKPYLQEIFKVARLEERFLNGEVDATARVYVMSSARGDTDTDDESEDGVKNEEEENDTASLSTCPPAAETPLPTAMIQQPQIQPQQIQPRPDENTMFLGMRQQLPYRYHPQSMEEHTGSFADNSAYVPNVAFPQQHPTIHDQTRRSFAGQGYNSAQQSLYGWQNMASSSSVTSSYYTTSPQTTLPTYQLPPPSIAQQNMLPPPNAPPFDSLPTRIYDTGTTLGSQFRTGSLSHPHHVSQHHDFQQYLQDNSGYSPDLKNSPDHHHTQ